MKFSDLKKKLDTALAQAMGPMTHVMHPNGQLEVRNRVRKAVVNAHAKFYGLRSKYDGRGNLREPMKG